MCAAVAPFDGAAFDGDRAVGPRARLAAPDRALGAFIDEDPSMATENAPQLQLTLTCPTCRARTTETMPTDACEYLYDCPACRVLLKPKPGDCCVFCSYRDVPCPPRQNASS